MAQIAIVYHSKSGRTKIMAEQIAMGAKGLSDEVRIFNCLDTVDFEYLNAADAIIFGSPTYLGSVSGEMKMFMDRATDVYKHQKWRNKIAAGFTTSASLSGDKLNTLIQIAIFAFQHGMIWVGLDLPPGISASYHTDSRMNRIGSWIGLMSQANGDQSLDISPPESDRDTAQYFGKRIAEWAKKLKESEKLEKLEK